LIVWILFNKNFKAMPNRTLSLINHRDDELCLSVIIPTYRFVALKTFSQAVIKKHIGSAKLFLTKYHARHPEKKVNELIPLLDKAVTTIGADRSAKGVGIFISSSVQEVIYFPFEVKERVALGKSFEVRELLMFQDYTSPFFVLALNKNIIKLYKGNAIKLEEITNADFPIEYHDDYEYARPSRGTSFGGAVKSYEKDKGTLSEIRHLEFLSKADQHLIQYLNATTPFILCGTTELVSNFHRLTQNKELEADALIGNYNDHLLSELTKRLQEGKIKFQIEKIKSIPEWLENEFGKKMVVQGIESVWKAAQEGNCQMLLVEKDYRTPAYIKFNEMHKLFLAPPKDAHEIVPDAVNEVLGTVIKKGGKVKFVENELLRQFDHIAMWLRYPIAIEV
jgi:Bacterial archaeo-eukaryotic release factor family 3